MKGCFWAAHVLFKNSLWKVMDCGRISTSYAYWSQNVWAAEHLSSETVVKLRILRRLLDHVLKRLSWVGPYNLLPLINLIRSYVFWYPMFLLYTVTCKVVKYLTKTPLTWRTTSLCLFGFESKPLGHKNPRTDFSCTSNACISKKTIFATNSCRFLCFCMWFQSLWTNNISQLRKKEYHLQKCQKGRDCVSSLKQVRDYLGNSPHLHQCTYIIGVRTHGFPLSFLTNCPASAMKPQNLWW